MFLVTTHCSSKLLKSSHHQTRIFTKYIHNIYTSLFDQILCVGCKWKYFLVKIYSLDLLTHMQKNDGEMEESKSNNKTEEENDKVTELPEIPALQHLAKNRPKRPKKHASSRNVVKVNIISKLWSQIWELNQIILTLNTKSWYLNFKLLLARRGGRRDGHEGRSGNIFCQVISCN